jgi:hypothetical protein
MLSVLCYRKFLFEAYFIRSLYGKFMLIDPNCDITFMELKVFCLSFIRDELFKRSYFLAFTVHMMVNRCPSVRILLFPKPSTECRWQLVLGGVHRMLLGGLLGILKSANIVDTVISKRFTWFTLRPKSATEIGRWTRTPFRLGQFLEVKQKTWKVLD